MKNKLKGDGYILKIKKVINGQEIDKEVTCFLDTPIQTKTIDSITTDKDDFVILASIKASIGALNNILAKIK